MGTVIVDRVEGIGQKEASQAVLGCPALKRRYLGRQGHVEGDGEDDGEGEIVCHYTCLVSDDSFLNL